MPVNKHLGPEPEEPDTDKCNNCEQETEVSKLDDDLCGVCGKPYYPPELSKWRNL